ncbi:hypothetical protein ACKC5O_20320, partial [Aeromonas schubertii]
GRRSNPMVRSKSVRDLALTENIIQRAKKIGIKKLYLQTEALSGGLYSSCGFMPIEQVEYKGHNVLVMVAELDT